MRWKCFALSALMLMVAMAGCGGGGGDASYTPIGDAGDQASYAVTGRVTQEDRGLEGVTIIFSGGFEAVVTDSDGNWRKGGLQGDVQVVPSNEGCTFAPCYITVSFAPGSKIVSGARGDVNFALRYWQNVGTAGFSAGQAEYTSLALDPGGTPYIAYRDASNDGKATVMMFDGSSWAAVGSRGFSAGEASYIDLAVDDGGTPYVAFLDHSNWRATVMAFDGTSWGLVGAAGFSGGLSMYISLAIDSVGTPYVSYQDASNGYKATVMTFDGANWGPVGSAGLSGGLIYYTSLAIDDEDTPYIAYQDRAVIDNIKATVMKFDGVSWTAVGDGIHRDQVYHPSLAVDHGGTPYVAYGELMTFSGTTWDQVGGGSGYADGVDDGAPCLAIDGDGISYLAYKDFDAYATVMAFDLTESGHLGELAFSAGEVNYLSLAIDHEGTPYVAYQDQNNGGRATVMRFAP